jgi:hypothetical protein
MQNRADREHGQFLAGEGVLGGTTRKRHTEFNVDATNLKRRRLCSLVGRRGAACDARVRDSGVRIRTIAARQKRASALAAATPSPRSAE